MTPNADLIRAFYAAFARRDHVTMAGCYGPGATFTDPVFGELSGPRIAAMWRMLCERARDLHIEVSGIHADANRGAAHWDGRYTIASTHRSSSAMGCSTDTWTGSTSMPGPGRRSGSGDSCSAGLPPCKGPSVAARPKGSMPSCARMT